MDPNTNLAEQERILERKRMHDALLPRMIRGDMRRLKELRASLAQWLSNGGFAPDWAKCPLATKYYKATQN